MYRFVLVALAVSVVADAQSQPYSFSPAVGSGSGNPYSITGEGRITAVRFWESFNSIIYGVQLRYGGVWSAVAGHIVGQAKELELFEGETIIQVSGKYSHFIHSIMFVTSQGRSLSAGQPHGHSFNMYPSNSQAELVFISGRTHGALTAFGAHWAVINSTSRNEKTKSLH
ncbi:uncharacterized protein V6R79_014607 [Siganus canaliculatus]